MRSLGGTAIGLCCFATCWPFDALGLKGLGACKRGEPKLTRKCREAFPMHLFPSQKASKTKNETGGSRQISKQNIGAVGCCATALAIPLYMGGLEIYMTFSPSFSFASTAPGSQRSSASVVLLPVPPSLPPASGQSPVRSSGHGVVWEGVANF